MIKADVAWRVRQTTARRAILRPPLLTVHSTPRGRKNRRMKKHPACSRRGHGAAGPSVKSSARAEALIAVSDVAMPDKRTHRGPHPGDGELFAPGQWPVLQRASSELAWLLDRGYALRSALALVGDRHGLIQRQRIAIARCGCSAEQLRQRAATEIRPDALSRAELWIDGYNLLITIESALAGGLLLRGRDGVLRDMASLHGTYRRVSETETALRLIGEALAQWGVPLCRWVLDRPVANSGRLKAVMTDVAQAEGWPWTIQLEQSPDGFLVQTAGWVATSDSVVLDRARGWFNAARHLVTTRVPGAVVIDLSPNPCSSSERSTDRLGEASG